MMMRGGCVHAQQGPFGREVVPALQQSQLEDGAARLQKEKYIQHIVRKQIQHPNSKNQDTMEESVIYEESKPWTHSITAFKAKLATDPDCSDFQVSVVNLPL